MVEWPSFPSHLVVMVAFTLFVFYISFQDFHFFSEIWTLKVKETTIDIEL